MDGLIILYMLFFPLSPIPDFSHTSSWAFLTSSVWPGPGYFPEVNISQEFVWGSL